MIIKLTPDEVKSFVSAALNLNPSRFEIEIVSPATAVRDCSLITAFRATIREFPLHTSIQKIQAIKRFRELAPKHDEQYGYHSSVVGLADAKWAVENSPVALLNLERTGSLRG